jgi:hypothetical protein
MRYQFINASMSSVKTNAKFVDRKSKGYVEKENPQRKIQSLK